MISGKNPEVKSAEPKQTASLDWLTLASTTRGGGGGGKPVTVAMAVEMAVAMARGGGS